MSSDRWWQLKSQVETQTRCKRINHTQQHFITITENKRAFLRLLDLQGVYSAPKGATQRVASSLDDGQQWNDSLVPLISSEAETSQAPPSILIFCYSSLGVFVS